MTIKKGLFKKRIRNSHIDDCFEHQIVSEDGFYHLQKDKPLNECKVSTNTKIAFECVIKRKTYSCKQFQIQNGNMKTMIIKWSLSMSNHHWERSPQLQR